MAFSQLAIWNTICKSSSVKCFACRYSVLVESNLIQIVGMDIRGKDSKLSHRRDLCIHSNLEKN